MTSQPTIAWRLYGAINAIVVVPFVTKTIDTWIICRLFHAFDLTNRPQLFWETSHMSCIVLSLKKNVWTLTYVWMYTQCTCKPRQSVSIFLLRSSISTNFSSRLWTVQNALTAFSLDYIQAFQTVTYSKAAM
jgi:hypothetical protein